MHYSCILYWDVISYWYMFIYDYMMYLTGHVLYHESHDISRISGSVNEL